MAQNDDFKYPLPKFHFELEWGGVRIGFTEVSGLDFETEVIEYREGHLRTYNKTKQPGLTKFSDVTLKRGIVLDNFEYYEQWVKTAMFQEKKEQYRRTVTIKLLNEEHNTIITWTLAKAWPSKIQSTDLKADANEVAIETMTLVHEGLVMAKP
ncbi:MAG: phage tail protein [Chitinophagaceae bacterium]|nr:phage tail protein [Chitinophagaceae bacterium]